MKSSSLVRVIALIGVAAIILGAILPALGSLSY